MPLQEGSVEGCFSKKQVTVHPCVIHHCDEEGGPLLHTTVTVLSYVTSDKAQTISAIIKSLTAWLCTNMPASSRSTTRRILRRAGNKLQVSSESGHRKGPCDGMGESMKRSADRAIKNGEVIQGAEMIYR